MRTMKNYLDLGSCDWGRRRLMVYADTEDYYGILPLKRHGVRLKFRKELARDGMTMVTVTHEMGFAREVGNRILFMASGKLVEEGSPTDIFEHPQSPRLQDFLRKVL